MKRKEKTILAADFETTVYDGQKSTEVWSSAFIEIGKEAKPVILRSIYETLIYWLKTYDGDILAYYHNLKFDGMFWVDWLLRNGFEYSETQDRKKQKNNTIICVISDMGMWYSVYIRVKSRTIELRDSLKILPFTLKQAGKAFKTKHQKLDMEYKGERSSNYVITPEEKSYIENDVYVLKECIEFMYSQGHKKLTIGSCCMAEFKKGYTKEALAELFPDLTEVGIRPYGYIAKTEEEYKKIAEQFGASDAYDYIRKSYKGGWCYIVPEKANQIKKAGFTADVNSLYPSMMSSESGNRYPVGLPHWWAGNYIPPEAEEGKKYYFVRFKCSFTIKKNKLPFVQIKGSPFYKSTEALKYSNPTYKGKKVKSVEIDGRKISDIVTLTMTKTDWILFNEHYTVKSLEILDGCWFDTEIGLFDRYIDKYKKLKQESTGALRTLSKLFLNNLYGKFASSDNSTYEVPYIDKEKNCIAFKAVEEHDKKAGYIAIGSAITSYARNFTIRAAQANYYGEKRRGFIYADTDSIHCDLPPEEVKGIKVDPKAFCCWKLESYWDEAIFLRQKTYIEHVTHEDGDPIEEPYYTIKCAGMPEASKSQLRAALERGSYYMAFFRKGLELGGKLRPVRIAGGIVLVDTTYKIR